MQSVGETDMMKENEVKDGKSRKYTEDSERVKWLSGREDGRFRTANEMCERYPGETCKYVVIATWLLVM